MGNYVSSVNPLDSAYSQLKCSVAPNIHYLLVQHNYHVEHRWLAYGKNNLWGVIIYPTLETKTQSCNFIPKYNELLSQIQTN